MDSCHVWLGLVVFGRGWLCSVGVGRGCAPPVLAFLRSSLRAPAQPHAVGGARPCGRGREPSCCGCDNPPLSITGVNWAGALLYPLFWGSGVGVCSAPPYTGESGMFAPLRSTPLRSVFMRVSSSHPAVFAMRIGGSPRHIPQFSPWG